MNKTLVENSQHQIDDQNGNAQQQGQVLQRRLKYLRGALKRGGNRARQCLLTERLYFRGGLAQRNAGLQVKRDRRGRQLAEMIDLHRTDGPGKLGDRTQRNQPAV